MKLRTLIVSSLIGLSLVACNAGSVIPSSTSTSASPTPSSSATATPIPTSSPFTAMSSAVTVPTSGGTVTAPAAGGFTTSLTLPGLSSALSGTATAGGTAPVGVSTFSEYERVVQSKPSNATSLYYLSLVPTTSTAILAGNVSLTVSLPNYSSSASYYLAIFDGTLWHTEYTTTPGSVTSSGSGVTFSFMLSSNYAINAGTTYALCLYAVPSSATPSSSTLLATSTPGVLTTATPTATATASATSTASPTSTATASATPTSTAISTSGSVALSTGQTLTGFTTADGSSGSLTLPSFGSGSVNYTIVTSAPSGVTGPTNGSTFLGGATVTTTSAVSLTTSQMYGYTFTPSSTTAGKTLYFYILQSGSSAYPVGSATAPAAGVVLTSSTATVPLAVNVPTGSTYTLAIYYK